MASGYLHNLISISTFPHFFYMLLQFASQLVQCVGGRGEIGDDSKDSLLPLRLVGYTIEI